MTAQTHRARPPLRGRKERLTCTPDRATRCTAQDTPCAVSTSAFTTAHCSPLRGSADAARSAVGTPGERARGAARFAGRALRRRWRDIEERLRALWLENVWQAEPPRSFPSPLENGSTLRACPRARATRPLDCRSGEARVTAFQRVLVTRLSPSGDRPFALVASDQRPAAGGQQLEGQVDAGTTFGRHVARPGAGTCEARKGRSRCRRSAGRFVGVATELLPSLEVVDDDDGRGDGDKGAGEGAKRYQNVAVKTRLASKISCSHDGLPSAAPIRRPGWLPTARPARTRDASSPRVAGPSSPTPKEVRR